MIFYMPSMSVSKGAGNVKHNKREQSKHPKNVDPDRTKDNLILIDKNIKDVYQYEFGSAINLYNSKQKRSDRKIDDYYSKIAHDKKTKVFHELVVQIGNKDDVLDHHVTDKIYKDFLDQFIKDNPQLIVFGAYIHNDESTPHLHLDYVPIAEYDKGLTRRVSNNKAIQQMGYSSWADWKDHQFSILENVSLSYGVKRDLMNNTAKHIADVQLYKNELHKTQKRVSEELSRIPVVEVQPKEIGFKKRLYVQYDDFQRVAEENKLLKQQNLVLDQQLAIADKTISNLKSKSYVVENEQLQKQLANSVPKEKYDRLNAEISSLRGFIDNLGLSQVFEEFKRLNDKLVSKAISLFDFTQQKLKIERFAFITVFEKGRKDSVFKKHLIDQGYQPPVNNQSRSIKHDRGMSR